MVVAERNARRLRLVLFIAWATSAPDHNMNFRKPPTQRDRSVALLDARYLSWLAHGARVNRHGVAHMVARALDGAGLPSLLMRTYWYSDRDDGQTLDDQTQRLVPHYDVDGGAAVASAIAADVLALAQRGACDTVVIASDDDRLVSAMEEAKLYGMRVCVLGDEAMSDLSALAEEDASSARLLRQADRRLLINTASLGQGGGAAKEVSDAWPRVQEMVNAWWTERDPDEAAVLQQMLQSSHGLPQDLDRLMLARARAALGRTLDISEKRQLRSLVRDAVLKDAPKGDGLPQDDEQD